MVLLFIHLTRHSQTRRNFMACIKKRYRFTKYTVDLSNSEEKVSGVETYRIQKPRQVTPVNALSKL